MIPLCFVGALLLVSQAVPQTFADPVDYSELCGDKGTLFLGPAARQIIIKQLFTNGGGFWGVNSAFPFENPTPFSNLIECISIILIPVALCFTFGKAVKDSKQGRAVFVAMTVIFVICLAVCTVSECGFSGKATEKRFGQITKRCVLYRGKSYTEENGIEYKNVEEYLCELGK